MSYANLLDSTPDELVTLVEGWGEPGYRGRQLASWVYAKGVRDFSAMSNLLLHSLSTTRRRLPNLRPGMVARCS